MRNLFRSGTLLSAQPGHYAVDVGVTDAEGNNVPYVVTMRVPEYQPQVGDRVRLAYYDENEHTAYIAGGGLVE